MKKSPTLSEEEFRTLWFEYGQSPTVFSRETGRSIRGIISRAVEMGLPTVSNNPGYTPPENGAYTRSRDLHVEDGVVLIASDMHVMPGQMWPALSAFVEACKQLQPVAIVMNGDLADHANLSRHVRVGWNPRVRVAEELHAVQSALQDIRDAAPKAKTLRTIGNHDLRFDGRLSNVAPEYEGIAGMSLADHLPDWPDSWRVEINGTLAIKHRFRGGVHAAWNNTLHAGMSIACGHDHTLEVKATCDYRGRRYGIQTGMLADPSHWQFEYAEDNPNRWQPGFVVLTFHRGEMLPPELCEVRGGQAWFRGSLLWSAGNERKGRATASEQAARDDQARKGSEGRSARDRMGARDVGRGRGEIRQQRAGRPARADDRGRNAKVHAG